MKNTGILLFLAGIYLVINSGSFRDLVMGKASFGFVNPKDVGTSSTGGGSGGKPPGGNIPL